jgi:hypothetical protein
MTSTVATKKSMISPVAGLIPIGATSTVCENIGGSAAGHLGRDEAGGEKADNG